MARIKEKALTLEEKLAQALVPVEEQPYEVPENWCWVYLTKGFAECKDVFRKPINATERSGRSGEIPYYGATGQVGWIDDYLTNEELVLLGEDGAPFLDLMKDKAYLIFGKAWVNNHAHILISLFGHSGNVFLMNYLNVFNFTGFVNGTTRLKLTQASMDTIPVPLAPASEQHRIVERIESLFAQLDQAKEKAHAVIDGYEDRRVSILHRAFTGELTEEWRRESGLTMDDWSNIPWGDFITSIEAGKNWNADGRPPHDGEFGVVKVSAVTWGEFNEGESKTCRLAEQWNEKVQIHTGDFLFSRANTLQLVGNCVIVSDVSKRLMLSDKILRLTFSDVVVPRYVLHFTRSDFYRKQIEDLATGNQDGMRNVSQSQMRKVVFPVPTLAEQHEIVRILDSLLTKESAAKSASERAIDQIDTMKKSILARAFRSELGTNNPEDEPALNLLKRTLEGAE